MRKDLKPLSVKAPLHLLPARATRAGISAIEYGALKYQPWNWQDTSLNQQRIDELLAALMRHATAAADPAESDRDDESGLHHIAHAWACCTLLLHKLGLDYEPSTLKLKAMRQTHDDVPPDVSDAAVVIVNNSRPEEPRCAEYPEPQQPPINPT